MDSLRIIQSWGLNTIRVPLNEHCWLGINGVDSRYSGQLYRDAIVEWVNTIRGEGMVAILDLHWTHHGTNLAYGLRPMLNRDHSIALWESVAETFKHDLGILLEPHNEPFPDNNAVYVALTALEGSLTGA